MKKELKKEQIHQETFLNLSNLIENHSGILEIVKEEYPILIIRDNCTMKKFEITLKEV
jgi:hypothetical protein